MSVLIKIDMPKSCHVCDFMRKNDDIMSTDYRFMFCVFPGMGKFVTDYKNCRPSDCPLLDVPAHGRLIDADALKDLYHYNMQDSDIDKAWIGNIRRSIDNAPTVIEAEE